MKFPIVALLALCCAMLPLAPADAASAVEALLEDFPSGSISSADRAQLALERLPGARNEVDMQFAREKADCYDRFFVSDCLSDVKQRQREARGAVRKVEVEARAFLRRDRAAERDRAVAEREQAAAKEKRTIPWSGAARDTGPSAPAEAGSQ